jgi:hypothetical protein
VDDDTMNVLADPYLIQLIVSLEAAAMQQMGKLQNPLTGEVERNLELAKSSIDMLAMLQKKTDGNLTEDESTLLKRTLYQLRMNYVDEKNADSKADSEEQGAESEDDAIKEAAQEESEEDSEIRD